MKLNYTEWSPWPQRHDRWRCISTAATPESELSVTLSMTSPSYSLSAQSTHREPSGVISTQTWLKHIHPPTFPLSLSVPPPGVQRWQTCRAQISASLSFLISHWLPLSNIHFLFVLSRSLSLVVCIFNPSNLSLSKVFAPCHQPACCSPLKPQAWPGTMASLGGTHPAVWLARWQRDAPILGQQEAGLQDFDKEGGEEDNNVCDCLSEQWNSCFPLWILTQTSINLSWFYKNASSSLTIQAQTSKQEPC